MWFNVTVTDKKCILYNGKMFRRIARLLMREIQVVSARKQYDKVTRLIGKLEVKEENFSYIYASNIICRNMVVKSVICCAYCSGRRLQFYSGRQT